MSETDQFKVEHEDHIAWLTLNRPAKRNVMGSAFFKELSEHLAKLRTVRTPGQARPGSRGPGGGDQGGRQKFYGWNRSE